MSSSDDEKQMWPVTGGPATLFFLRRFLSDPKGVAALCPSSRFLSQRMLFRANVESGHSVLELGPGTGAFTEQIAKRKRAGADIRYLGIERDPQMHAFLCERYPELNFVVGDAVDVDQIVKDSGLPPATFVMCGVPLILMPRDEIRRVLLSVCSCMARGGTFRLFSYLHCCLSSKAIYLRAQVRDVFNHVQIVSELRNLPPALVIAGYV